MKKTVFWALPLAASLTLSGCSGLLGPDPEPSASASAFTQIPEPTEGGFDSPDDGTDEGSGFGDSSLEGGDSGFGDDSLQDGGSGSGPDEGATAADEQLSAGELVKVAQAVESHYGGSDAEVVGSLTLKDDATTLEKAVAGVLVTPADCTGYATSSTHGMLDHMNMVAVNLPADSNSGGTSIAINSFDDVSNLNVGLVSDSMRPVNCASYTIDFNGRKTSGKVTSRDATTDATTTLAIEVVAEVLATPDGNDVGKTTRTLRVSGYDGVNAVAVGIVDPRDADAAVDKAEEYINLALQRISAS